MADTRISVKGDLSEATECLFWSIFLDFQHSLVHPVLDLIREQDTDEDILLKPKVVDLHQK